MRLNTRTAALIGACISLIVAASILLMPITFEGLACGDALRPTEPTPMAIKSDFDVLVLARAYPECDRTILMRRSIAGFLGVIGPAAALLAYASRMIEQTEPDHTDQKVVKRLNSDDEPASESPD